MFKSWRLGTLFGFPVDVNVSFVLLLGLVFLAFGGLAGVVLVCLAFASIVLHELGHALVARTRGVRISGIELSFFGGAAKMVELPRTANDELAIAAAGPIVSLALGGASLLLAGATHLALFSWLGWTNLILAAFNLIPALPMDGGRILRALLTRKLDYLRATDVSVRIAHVTAVAFAIVGLLGAYELVFLAPYLWIIASRERHLAREMAHQYASGRGGYRPRGDGDVEVLGPDAWNQRGATPWHDRSAPRGFAIRQRGGRLVIEEL